MPNTRKLLILPFEDILEPYLPFEHVLWFYPKGYRTIIGDCLINISVLEKLPFEEVNFNDFFYDMYGQNFVELVLNDYYQALTQLDRCKAMFNGIEEDEQLIRLFMPHLIEDLFRYIKNLFTQDTIWMLDRTTSFKWIRDTLVIPILD